MSEPFRFALIHSDMSITVLRRNADLDQAIKERANDESTKIARVTVEIIAYEKLAPETCPECGHLLTESEQHQ